MKVVVQVRARADQEIEEPALHHFDDAATKAGRRHRPSHGQPGRGVILRREHLVRKNLARLRQPSRIERLKAVVDERSNRRMTCRTVVLDLTTGEVLARTARGRSRGSMWHA